MKNYITGNDMLLHSSKVQNWKGESHATTTGCSMINCTIHPPVVRDCMKLLMLSCPQLNVNLDIMVLVLVSFIKSNFEGILFLSTIGLGYIDITSYLSYVFKTNIIY